MQALNALRLRKPQAPLLPIPRLLPQWEFLQSHGGSNRMIALFEDSAELEYRHHIHQKLLAGFTQQYEGSVAWGAPLTLGTVLGGGIGGLAMLLALGGARSCRRRTGRLAMIRHNSARPSHRQGRAPGVVEIESIATASLASKSAPLTSLSPA